MNLNYSYTNLIAWSAIIIFILSQFVPGLYNFAINNLYFLAWQYDYLALQFVFYSFLHGDIFHIIWNMLFIIIFWNKVENLIWAKNFLIFFLFITISIAIGLLTLSNATTLWMSWFGSALLSFYTYYLYSSNDPEYKWGITWLFILIAMWFHPHISFIGHFLWVILWLIYAVTYLYIKKRINK